MKAINFLLILGTIATLYSCSESRDKRLNVLQEEIIALKKALSNSQKEKQQVESNKKLVVDFYQEVFGDLNSEAVNKYIGDVYIQHNPKLTDGRQTLYEATKVWFKGATPSKIDVQRVIAEGDLVFIHLRTKNGGILKSTMDVFRIDNNKIKEHWDVHQEVPKETTNPHPMF